VGYISPHAITRDPSVRRGRGRGGAGQPVGVRVVSSLCLSVCDCATTAPAEVAGTGHSLTAAPVPQQYSSAAAAAPRRPRLTG